MGELDDFLKSFKEEEERKKEAIRPEWRKQKEFIASFKDALKDTIHPAMISILEKLRKRDGYGIDIRHRKKQSNPLTHVKPYLEPPKIDEKNKFLYRDYENYYISGDPVAEGYAMVFTIAGNYAVQKVSVLTEFLMHVRGSISASIKKSEEQFELEKFTAQTIEEYVVNKMKELAAIKDAADAGNAKI